MRCIQSFQIRRMDEMEYPRAGGSVTSSCDVRIHYTYCINRQIIRKNLQPLVIWGVGRTENFDKHYVGLASYATVHTHPHGTRDGFHMPARYPLRAGRKPSVGRSARASVLRRRYGPGYPRRPPRRHGFADLADAKALSLIHISEPTRLG